MEIRPVRNSEELRAARSRVSELIQINRNGKHSNEIEVLATLIESYEKLRFPIEAPSPVAAIKFRMQQMGLSARQLEPFIGSRSRVSEILNGKRQLSLDMIRSLHQGLSIPYDSLLGKQSIDYEEANGLLSQPLDQAIESRLIARQLDVLDGQSGQRFGRALHRRTRTSRTASRMDRTALDQWKSAVVAKASNVRLSTSFDPELVSRDFLRRVARTSLRSDWAGKLLHTLRGSGIVFVILPSFPGTYMDGATLVRSDGCPIIAMTLRHDRTDNFWFTLLHELAHVVLHYSLLREEQAAFIDDLEVRSEDAFEIEADRLARDSLVPRAAIESVNWGEDCTQDEIISVAIRARVSVAIAAGRWQQEHANYKKFSRLIERGTVRAAFDDSE